ncbi:MAG TPA: hypothetical protein VJ911_08815 [Cryomorphaceae bacterium]|nr:hypothetical protein [Cryomorphaceae bacterium]
MKKFRYIQIQVLLSFIGLLGFYSLKSQTPTFTLDNSFDSEELFNSPKSVSDFHFLEDGRILVGGGYSNDQAAGLTMIFNDGDLDVSWGYPFEPTALEIIAQSDGYVFPFIYGLSKVDLEGIPWIISQGYHFSDYHGGG